jgi:uncharacterized DUF497 family protein
MGTIISPDGRFEWDEAKNILNKKDHGFFFEEILAVFDDPSFGERTRIISARLAEPHERKYYDENYQQQITSYE